jgi:hypothetical protein
MIFLLNMDLSEYPSIGHNRGEPWGFLRAFSDGEIIRPVSDNHNHKIPDGKMNLWFPAINIPCPLHKRSASRNNTRSFHWVIFS